MLLQAGSSRISTVLVRGAGWRPMCKGVWVPSWAEPGGVGGGDIYGWLAQGHHFIPRTQAHANHAELVP